MASKKDEKKAKIKIEAEGTESVNQLGNAVKGAGEQLELFTEKETVSAKTSKDTSKAISEETKARKEHADAIKEETKALKENANAKRTITKNYVQNELRSTVVSDKTKVGGVTYVTRNTQPALPSREEISEVTQQFKTALFDYKNRISSLIQTSRLSSGFDASAIRSRLNDLSVQGVKTSDLLGKTNKIEEGFSNIENISKVTKQVENLIKKFSLGKISAEEFSSSMKSSFESAFESAESKTSSLTNRIEELNRSLVEKSVSSVKEYSEEYKKAFSNFKESATQSVKSTKLAYDEFKKNFNVEEIREKMDELGNMGGNVRSLRRDLTDLEKTFRSLEEAIAADEKKLKDLEEAFNKGELEERDFNKQSKELIKSINKNKQAVSELNPKFNDLKKNLKDAANRAKDTGGIFSGLANRMKIFFQYRAINATVNAIRDLSRAAVELESSFANIQAITSASDAEMGKLRNTILRVGEASKYSVEEIAKATTMLGQAGLSADEINNVLETTTQLAAGTGSELSNTVDLMTSALAVWGLNSEEASHLSDVMVTGMNRTKATLETFRMAVQYAGATMASLNVSFDEFASVAAAASNAGLRASVVGTGLRAMTSELISPTKKMVAGLAQLGLSTEDVNIESQGLVNVLYKLKNAGLTAANAYDLFGKRAAQFVLAAQGQLDVVDELRVAFNESGATLKAYGTQMDTISAQATALGNTIKAMASDVLDSVSGMIKGTLSALNEFIKNARLGGSLFFGNGEAPRQEAFLDYKKELDEAARSARAFNVLLDNINKRDYGDDLKKKMSDVNTVIKAMNEQLGLSIKYVDDLDDVPNKIKQLKNLAIGTEEAKIRTINSLRRQRGSEIIERGGTGGILSNIPVQERAERIPLIKSGAEKMFYDFETSNKSLIDFEVEVNARIKDLQEKGQNKVAENLKYAFDLMQEAVETSGEKAKSEIKPQVDDRIGQIELVTSEVNEKISELSDSLTNDVTKPTLEQLDNLAKSVELGGKSLSEYIDIEQDESVKSLIPDTTDLQKIALKGSSAKRSMIDAFTKYLTDLEETISDEIKAGVNVEDNKGLQNKIRDLKKQFSNLSALELYRQDLESRVKDTNINRKTQREIEREKARQFNLKYQGLAIQQQADEYNAQIEQAKRKGVQSRYAELDKTGAIASAYSRYSTDKERLEKFKTAYNNQQTLDKYMKDYGDLFKQVESGQVSLEDADNKSDKLISKMIELKKSTEEAKAEFGDLNETNLDKVNEEISDLDDKMKQLDDDSKTTFGQMKIGFQDAVKKMSDTYSFASIGKTIAEDLGNGMADALNSIVDGSKSMKDAFSDMARSILQDISKMLIRMAVMRSMFSLFGSGEPATQGQLIMGGEYANGGFIPKLRAAAGSMVRGGVQGKDSVPAMLMPGEYVLKKSAVDALGTNFLNDLNNNAAQTLTNTAANMVQNPYQEESKSEPAVVNVWVVSKEEEAKMGPNDVIATISKDIMVGGQTRRLIQQVVAGRK